MKLRYFSLIILTLIILSACSLREDYSMQYSFTSAPSTETKITPTADGVDIEFPFADFSCDAKSFKANLGRSNKTFIITLEGDETEERCSQQFIAEITGIKPGDYSLQLVYRTAQGDQQVMFNQFTVSE